MSFRVFTYFILLMLLFSGCEKTEMAPAPGSGKDGIVREMLDYMKKMEVRNREEREENRKALFDFMERQNKENREFLEGIMKKYRGTTFVPEETSETEVEVEETNTSAKTEATTPEEVTHSDSKKYEIYDFVEKDPRPEVVLGKWDPYSQHIDPSGFTEVNLDDYPVFPNEDRDADPNVSKELGGKGFGKWALANGWETNTTFPLVGDPKAKKGGEIVRYFPSFPNNLRPMGSNYNTSENYFIRFSLWQTLLWEHPTTGELVPCLVSHWKHSEDGKTHYLRINPNAKWNDGSPVTSEDILETYRFYTNADMGHPSYVQTWEEFEPPKKISKYIVSFTEKKKKYNNWYGLSRLFFTFPAKDLRKLKEPKDFNTVHNYYPVMGTCAYTYTKENVEDDQSVTIVRKKDWWGKDSRLYTGLFNFDRIKWVVILEPSLIVEKLKKGELDAFTVYTSRFWVKEMNFPEIQNGYIQKRMIFNHEPVGTQFISMNMENPPFDVWEVRRAFSHLFPFEKISSQLMFDAYPKLTSYYPGGVYENRDNPVLNYDQNKALHLLAKAGYKDRDTNSGLLVNEDGEPLKVTLVYSSVGLKPHLEMFQNSCKEVGIALTLQLVSRSTAFQKAQSRDYEMYSGAWGATAIPAPDTSWTGKKGGNNISGISSEKIDGWIEDYLKEFDSQKRIDLIRKIDRELVEINPYILTWYAPFKRLLWWNKFSYPAGVILRNEDNFYASALWWYDEEKANKLKESVANGTPMMAGGEKNKFWDNFRDWAEEHLKK